jgi:hypothetical protein
MSSCLNLFFDSTFTINPLSSNNHLCIKIIPATKGLLNEGIKTMKLEEKDFDYRGEKLIKS